METFKRLYGLAEAAGVLGGTSIWTLRKHVACGNVKVIRIGRRIFLNEQEIARISSEGLPPLRVRTEVAA
jgi:hypothetical protein